MTRTESFHSQLNFELTLLRRAIQMHNPAIVNIDGLTGLKAVEKIEEAEDTIEDKYLVYASIAKKIQDAYPDWIDRRFSDIELEEYQSLFNSDEQKELARNLMNIAKFQYLRKDPYSGPHFLFKLSESVLSGDKI